MIPMDSVNWKLAKFHAPSVGGLAKQKVKDVYNLLDVDSCSAAEKYILYM